MGNGWDKIIWQIIFSFPFKYLPYLDFEIDKLNPIEYDEMQFFGDFKELLRENKFVTHMYYEGTSTQSNHSFYRKVLVNSNKI